MHITFILSDLHGGGAQKMLINLANWVAKKNHVVDIVIFNAKGEYRDLISSEVQVYDLNKTRSLYAIKALSKYIAEKKPDILFSALYHVNIIAIFSRFFSFDRKTKLVISERNQISLYLNSCSLGKKILWKFLIYIFYRYSDHIIGISNGVCKDLKKILPSSLHSRIETIYNPVVTNDFLPAISKDIASLFPNECSTKIITSGRITPQKDYPTLLKAFSSYLEEDPHAHLVVLGVGVLETEIKQLSQRLGISDKITFSGFVSEPLMYLKQADMFVITSAWEGFCNVIVEALYCGLSVVSTDCPSGPSEILEGGRYGALCPVGEVCCIANSMKEVMRYPFVSEEQHKRALDFHVDVIGNKFLQCFEKVKKYDAI